MLETCLITGKLRDPSGTLLTNARVTFTLTSREKDGDILILPRPVVAQTDEAGNISVELWPNSLGNAGTAYVVQAATDGGYVQHPAWMAVVPDAETADINDISELVPPSSVNDALAAVVEAREEANRAEGYADQTALDRIATGEDRVATAADRIATGEDRVATGEDAAQTALDRIATGEDRDATAADAIATAADRIATGEDAVATAADRVATGEDALATADDRVATGEDAVATAADRVQTGEDRAAAAVSEANALTYAGQGDVSRQQAETARLGAENAEDGAEQVYADMLVALENITDYSDTLGQLNAVAKEIVAAADVVATFIYDTTRDSDGGAWRKRCRHTSWYNEPLNTATRGSRREFPSRALIVARPASVTIYDLDTKDCPMWARWTAINGGIINNAQTSVSLFALNGCIFVGKFRGSGALPGIAEFDFVADRARNWSATLAYRGVWAPLTTALTINTFNGNTPWVDMAVAGDVNAVAVAVPAGTPIDPVTKLPRPTIGCGTASGASVIHWDGRVTSSTSTTAVTRVAFAPDGTLLAATATQMRRATPAAYAAASFAFDDLTSSSIPAIISGTPSALTADAIATQNGLAMVRRAAVAARSSVAHVTAAYSTGHMIGDVKLALAESTADLTALVGGTATDRSAAANHPVIVGTVTRAAVATGAELAAYGGFSASNYLEVPYNASLDFGTGDFAYFQWIKFTGAGSDEIFRRSDAAFAGSYVRLYTSAGVLVARTGSVLLTGTKMVNDGLWHLAGVVRRLGSLELWIDSERHLTGADASNQNNGTATVTYGNRQGGGDPFDGGQIALPRIFATAPTPSQIREMYEAERHLFMPGAKCLLPGNSVSGLAYDDSTDLLHVATTGGSARLKGLLVTDKDATVYTGIDARDGVIATRDSGSADIVLPAIPLREAAAAAIGHNGGPPLYDPDEGEARASTANATPLAVPVRALNKGESGNFRVEVRGIKYDDASVYASYSIQFRASRPGEGNIAIEGTPSIVSTRSAGAWTDPTVTANTNAQAPNINIAGLASTNMEWVIKWDRF